MGNNRRVVRGLAIAIFAAALAAFTGAGAEAPFSKAQPVGYYRMMLGDIEVTALLDGLAPVPVGNLLRADDNGYLFVPAYYAPAQ